MSQEVGAMQAEALDGDTQHVQAAPDMAGVKCRNFLDTLLRLSSGKRDNVASRVKSLIQVLVDGGEEPEGFTLELHKSSKFISTARLGTIFEEIVT